MFSGNAQVSHQICQFFCQFYVSSCACDYGRGKQSCRLLYASHIDHNVIQKKEKKKRKMWSKKWYLKRNISYDGRLSFIHFGKLSALRCHRGVGR
jgi:hypothetical protein